MSDDTSTRRESDSTLVEVSSVPVLLMAYSPCDSDGTADRWPLTDTVTIGRKSPSILPIQDEWLSKVHFRIFPDEDGFYVEDLGSTNGTFVDGLPLVGKQKLKDATVIRAGRTIFVFHEDGEELLEPCPPDIYNIGGRFHVAPLLNQIRRLSNSRSNVLLLGPTGAGKELVAHALAKMAGRGIVIQNASRFRSDDVAAMGLFGVAAKVFTDVGERAGLIELSDGKFLFLDEAHALPQSVQRTLLRVFEDWQVTRVGETKARTVDVRFILASNDFFSETFGLEHDLLARIRVLKIPSLKARVADIPSIFRYIFRAKLVDDGFDADAALNRVFADHFECLCLDGFEKENTRGLIKIVDDVTSEMMNGRSPDQALKMVFEQRYENDIVLSRQTGKPKRSGPSPTAATDANGIEDEMMSLAKTVNVDARTLALIKDVYYDQRGVVKDIIERLRAAHDIKMSHRRAKKIIDAMGLPRIKRRRI